MNGQTSFTTRILWAVYISLLIVLLPHTAWAFRNFEPSGVNTWNVIGDITASDIIAYVGAFAFEAAIAVLTHKLSKHIERTPRQKTPWNKFTFQYINAIAFALVIATIVSALANLAHAVEFGGSLKIFAEFGIPFEVYSLAFGGILPLVSLTFARVLSNVVDDEDIPNPDLEKANNTISELRRQLRESEQRLRASEDNARISEERFGAIGDMVAHLFSEDKHQRIIAARKLWNRLPNSAIALIADSSPSYVSETLKELEVAG